MMILTAKVIILFVIVIFCIPPFTDGGSSYRSPAQQKLARQTRAYSGKDLGAFRYYQSQYFYQSRKPGYVIQTKWDSSRTCGNFEANSDGDYMGFFSCPLSFEWPNATYCCGEQGANYCCDDVWSSNRYWSDPFEKSWVDDLDDDLITAGIVTGSIFGGGFVIAAVVAIVCICRYQKRSRLRRGGNTLPPRVGPTGPAPTVGSYPVQVGGQSFPMSSYPAPGAAVPPTVPPPGSYPVQRSVEGQSQPTPYSAQVVTEHVPPGHDLSSEAPPSYDAMVAYPTVSGGTVYPPTGNTNVRNSSKL